MRKRHGPRMELVQVQGHEGSNLGRRLDIQHAAIDGPLIFEMCQAAGSCDGGGRM